MEDPNGSRLQHQSHEPSQPQGRQGSRGAKSRVCRVSRLGIDNKVLGRYRVLGYVDP